MPLAAMSHLDHLLPAQQMSKPAEERRAPQHSPFGDERANKQGEKRKAPNDLITTPPAPAVSKVKTVTPIPGTSSFNRPTASQMPCLGDVCRNVKGQARSTLRKGQRGHLSAETQEKDGTKLLQALDRFPGANEIVQQIQKRVSKLNGNLKLGEREQEIQRIVERNLRRNLRMWDTEGVIGSFIHQAVEIKKGDTVELAVNRALAKIETLVRKRVTKITSKERRPIKGRDLGSLFAQIEDARPAAPGEPEPEAPEALTADTEQKATKNIAKPKDLSRDELLAIYPEARDAKYVQRKEKEREAQLQASYPEFYEEPEEPKVTKEDEYDYPELAEESLRPEPIPRNPRKINLS